MLYLKRIENQYGTKPHVVINGIGVKNDVAAHQVARIGFAEDGGRVEADAFEKATLEKMPTITMREASRNFSSLVYKIYDNGYVMLTKRNAPICAIYSYELISRCKDLDVQYIKKEKS